MAAPLIPSIFEQRINRMRTRIERIRSMVAEARASVTTEMTDEAAHAWALAIAPVAGFCITMLYLYDDGYLKGLWFDRWYAELIERW